MAAERAGTGAEPSPRQTERVNGAALECPFMGGKPCNDFCGIFDQAIKQCSILTISIASTAAAEHLLDIKKNLAYQRG